MNDHDFVEAFEACALSSSDFHHDDHVRLAWIYLRRHALIEAIERFRESLKRFAAHHGIPGLYHESITWAYLLLIHQRMHLDGAPNEWSSFRAANSDLFERKPSILERYYAPGTLGSAIARRIFVLPDAGIDARAR